jgi:hypothetical protein
LIQIMQDVDELTKTASERVDPCYDEQITTPQSGEHFGEHWSGRACGSARHFFGIDFDAAGGFQLGDLAVDRLIERRASRISDCRHVSTEP